MQETVKKLIDELNKAVELESTVIIKSLYFGSLFSNDIASHMSLSEIPQKVEYNNERSLLSIYLTGDNFVQYRLDMYDVIYEDDLDIFGTVGFSLEKKNKDGIVTIDCVLAAEN